MTRVIHTRVDDLKPGDVLLDGRIVLQVRQNLEGERDVHLWAPSHTVFDRFDGCTSCMSVANDFVFNVGVSDLTPAQAHADLLLGAVEKALDTLASVQPGLATEVLLREWVKPARVLVKQVRPKPPEPPTLEEITDALAKVARAAHAQGLVLPPEDQHDVEQLLARARATGVLK
jgi:hypothetical protein